MSEGYSNPKFLCCHVRTATAAIAIIVMVMACIGMVASVVVGLHAGGFKGFLQVMIGLIISFANILFAGLLLVGVKRNAASFMIVYLVWQVLSVIGWLVLMTILGVGLAAVAAISNQEKDSLNKEQIKKEGMALIGYMITCAILIVSGVVFFIIILRCYKYLRDVRSLSDNRGVSLSLIA